MVDACPCAWLPCQRHAPTPWTCARSFSSQGREPSSSTTTHLSLPRSSLLDSDWSTPLEPWLPWPRLLSGGAFPEPLLCSTSVQVHHCLRHVMLRSVRTSAYALCHRIVSPPCPTDRAPWPSSFGLLRHSSTQTDHASTFVVPRRTSRAPRLTGSTPVVGCHQITGRQATCYRG
jgi:hypothetical protein